MFKNILQKNFFSTTIKTLSSNRYRSIVKKLLKIIFTTNIFDFNIILNNLQN